jgi:hypothetical protein
LLSDEGRARGAASTSYVAASIGTAITCAGPASDDPSAKTLMADVGLALASQSAGASGVGVEIVCVLLVDGVSQSAASAVESATIAARLDRSPRITCTTRGGSAWSQNGQRASLSRTCRSHRGQGANKCWCIVEAIDNGDRPLFSDR